MLMPSLWLLAAAVWFVVAILTGLCVGAFFRSVASRCDDDTY